MIKSLSRNQKPDYPKFIKKAYLRLSQYSNTSSSTSFKTKNNMSF